MKKLSLVLALLAMVGVVLVSGCSPSEAPKDAPKDAPAPPAAPSTNAPAK